MLSAYLLDEVADTLKEPEVRALRGLTDSQIDAFVSALTRVGQCRRSTAGTSTISPSSASCGSSRHCTETSGSSSTRSRGGAGDG